MSDELDLIAKDVETGVLAPVKPTILERLLNRPNRITQGFMFLLMILMITMVLLTPWQTLDEHLPLLLFLTIVVGGIYYVQRSLPVLLKPKRRLSMPKRYSSRGNYQPDQVVRPEGPPPPAR